MSDPAGGNKWFPTSLVSHVFTLIGVLALAVAVYWIYSRMFPPAPPIQPSIPGVVIQAPLPPGKPGKEIERIIERAIVVPGPERIVYIDKPAVAASLKFPEIALLHDNVIAVATAAPHKGRTTVVATIGPDLDNVWRGGILLRQEAVPFLGREREWHGGIWYGLGGRNTLQGELEILPMRIGHVYPSAKGIIGLENEGNLNGQLLLGVRF